MRATTAVSSFTNLFHRLPLHLTHQDCIIRRIHREELRMRVVWVRLAAAIAMVLLAALSATAEDLAGPVSFVPWKVVIPGDAPPKAPLTLFWIPASKDDFKHSELLFSRPLTAFASQCVAMEVIRTDDAAVSTYKSIWDQRCVAPRKAREAQRELKKLGVALADASS